MDARAIVCPGIQVNHFDLPEAGDEIELHAHPYGHFGAVLTGAILVLGLNRELRPADEPIFFPAGLGHGYRAIEPSTHAIAIIDTTQPTFDPET
jgi:quercetin dioxygenase-like cupin family protein